jgi:hypothetical protein
MCRWLAPPKWRVILKVIDSEMSAKCPGMVNWGTDMREELCSMPITSLMTEVLSSGAFSQTFNESMKAPRMPLEGRVKI